MNATEDDFPALQELVNILQNGTPEQKRECLLEIKKAIPSWVNIFVDVKGAKEN